MKFNSENPRYTARFISQMTSFIHNYKLFNQNDELLIAVSGGIDSVVLLYSIYLLQSCGYSNDLRVIHINHNSRIGQDEEEKFVKELCRHLEIECLAQTLEGLDIQRNFENNARVKRYDAFYAIARAQEKILLAHHIDDSFEWTMLQSLRSSSIEGLVGIPVVNGRVIRPFMCVTKKQIEAFARAYDLPYIQDPTNEMIKYERNFIRNEVITAFKDRYQKYLKHYVYRHNEIARRLGMHLVEKHQSSFHISFSKETVLIYNISTQMDVSGLNQLVLQGIKHLNPGARGSLSLQLQKLSKAMENNKTGPLLLSAGIQAYLDFNVVLLTRKPDDLLLQAIPANSDIYTFDQFSSLMHALLTEQSSHLLFPFIFKISKGKVDKRKFNTSFNSKTVHKLKSENAHFYPGLKLLREWSKKRNRHKVLGLNLMGFPS